MLDLFNSLADFGDTLRVKVTPKAASNKVKVEHLSDGTKLIRVYVTTLPEDGKANKAVLRLLAKELGVAQSALTITHGLKSKDKIIAIKQ